ncbi:MAG: hypothetical protein WCF90_05555 [Methanomicrobiales archaeon]
MFSEKNQRNEIKIARPFMTFHQTSEHKENDADTECAVPVTGRCTISGPSVEIRTHARGKC